MFNYDLKPGRKKNDSLYVIKKPKISIITPFYKGHDFLEETAKCVLNQTYPYFEWIIVNDGSPVEGTKEFLEKIKSLDERIKVYHKQNEGLAATRDYGASKASKETKYLVFLDDDDLIDNTYLEVLYYSMETYKEASWAYTDVVNFGKQELLWKKRFDSKIMEQTNLLVATALIRKEAFNEVGGYKYRAKSINEDWLLWLRLIEKKHFPVHVSYPGFWYRIKGNGELALASKNQSVTNKLKAEIIKNISGKVEAIEFPRENYNWDKIVDDNIEYPEFKHNKKNILYIVPWMVVGGADKFNIDFLKSLDKKEYHITVISMQPSENVWRQQFEEIADEVFDLSSFIDCKYWPNFIKYIINSRNIDLIFNTNSTTGYMFLPYIKALYPNIPIIDYIHMEEWYNRKGGYSRDSASFGSVIDKTFFCNKRSEKIMSDYFERNEEELGTIYIGVDEQKFDPSKFDKKELLKKYNIPKNKKVIGFIARIDYQKRPLLLMEIIKKSVLKNKDYLFVIAGDGPLLDKLKSISKKNKLNDNIMFLGNIQKTAEIYAISDITLNCSIKEGLALTSYESLSMGTPVVSADVGGQSELIDSTVGIIVPCLQDEKDVYDFNYSDDEINQYVTAIQKIFKNLNDYKKNCRKRIIEGFTINLMGKKLKKEIDKVISKPNQQKINNGKELSNKLDIQKELITQYLLNNKGLYNYLCNEYNKKTYGSIYAPSKIRLYAPNIMLEKIACKLHLINEYYLLRDLVYYIYQIINNIFYILIIFPIRVCILFYTRVRNLIKRILKIEG